VLLKIPRSCCLIPSPTRSRQKTSIPKNNYGPLHRKKRPNPVLSFSWPDDSLWFCSRQLTNLIK
jgi:hypothetical protein